MEKTIGVRIDKNEEDALNFLARKSGRTKSSVVQRLISFAATNQEALKALGAYDNRLRLDGGLKP